MDPSPRRVHAAVQKPPASWSRPGGRARHMWTRAVQSDRRPANIGLHTACRRAQDRPTWRSLGVCSAPIWAYY